MIALFAALEMETRPILQRLRGAQRSRFGGFPVAIGSYLGQPVLLCQTGLGKRAAAAATVVIDHYLPQAVVSYGLAGALSPDLRAGDVTICERSCLEDAETPGEAVVNSDPELVSLALSALDVAPRRAGALTVQRVVAAPAEKARLRESWGLDLVEMEGYWVGQAAGERGIPFLAVRALFDEAGRALPQIPGIVTARGRSSSLRVVPHLIRHPRHIGELPRMARSRHLAIAGLVRLLDAFVAAYRDSRRAASLGGTSLGVT
jgi:adenosylhomocysteine nucleosidase